MEQIEKIISLTKKYVINTRKFLDECYAPKLPDEEELDIRKKITNLDFQLREAIVLYEEEQRRNQPPYKHTTVANELWDNKEKNNTIMYGKEKENFTRLTYESSYGHKQIYELDHEDASLDDVLDGFYALLIGATWHPQTILNGMKDFALEKLESLNPYANTPTDEE